MIHKPRLILDCDEVLSEFIDHALECLGGPLVRDQVTEWSWAHLLNESTRQAYNGLLQESQFWHSLPPRDEALALWPQLNAKYDIWICTAPYWPCDTWQLVRMTWLQKHFRFDKEKLICTQAKHLIGGNIFVDDRGDTVQRWRHENRSGHGFIMDQPWNRSYTEPRIFSLGALL